MESVDFLAMCTCIYSTGRERKRLFGCCFNPRPGFRVGKISQCACAFLDESLAWVLRKSLFYECTPSACNSPLAFAILQRSARSIPLFRADAPTIHLKNRRTFALFTTKSHDMHNEVGAMCSTWARRIEHQEPSCRMGVSISPREPALFPRRRCKRSANGA
jgi:hypothetical protein